MGFGPIKVFEVGIDSAGTSTSAFTMPQEFRQALLEIPTLSTAADFYILGSSNGTTFRRMMGTVPVTSSVQVNTFAIASAATNRIVPLPFVAPYMKVECSSAPASAATFKIICY